MAYPVYVSNKKFENCMDLLLITDKHKSHYVYIKDFNGLMRNKTKCRTKKHFCKYCWQCFSSERVLIEHKKICLKINGEQGVKLKSGSIEFKNHFKQLPFPFKLYADFECNVKGVKSNDKNNALYNKKCQDHVPCSFAYKVLWIDDRFSKPVLLYRGKNSVSKFIETILKEYDYCKIIIIIIIIKAF